MHWLDNKGEVWIVGQNLIVEIEKRNGKGKGKWKKRKRQ